MHSLHLLRAPKGTLNEHSLSRSLQNTVHFLFLFYFFYFILFYFFFYFFFFPKENGQFFFGFSHDPNRGRSRELGAVNALLKLG